MSKKLICTVTLLIIMLLCSSSVFATTSSSNTVSTGVTTLELVEKKLCEISLKDSSTNDIVGKFTKELTDFNSEKKEATLTLTLTNIMKEETIKKPVEVFLVLDDSYSMTKEYNGKSKSDYVAEAANAFTNSLFEHFENLKIGIISFSCAEQSDLQNSTFHDGTLDDAKLLMPLSNSKESIMAKIEEYKSNEYGQHTNIEAGLDLAEKNFSSSTESQKFVILISDGVPNLCLNTDTTLTYSGIIANSTQKKLKDMESKGYNVFSVLTNLADSELTNPMAPILESTGKRMTYGELAEEIFGTQTKPTVGKFFFINFNSLYDTVNKDIYNDILYINSNDLENISIKDYFPNEIVNNFDFEYVNSANIGNATEKIDTTTNSIIWNIEVLHAEEVATLSYKITLRDDYNKDIAFKILPTNEKVDIDYTYNNGVNNDNNSTDFSKIRVKYKDTSITPKPIPQTGIYNPTLFYISIAVILAFAMKKLIQIKKIKNKRPEI